MSASLDLQPSASGATRRQDPLVLAFNTILFVAGTAQHRLYAYDPAQKAKENPSNPQTVLI
jgi:hypothetical protein